MKQVIKITEKELRDSILNILNEDGYTGLQPAIQQGQYLPNQGNQTQPPYATTPNQQKATQQSMVNPQGKASYTPPTQQPQQQPQQATQTQQQPELQQGGNSNAMNRQMRRLQRNIQDATNYLNNPNDWKSVNNAFDSLGNCAKFLYRAMGNNVPVNEAQPVVASYVQLCQKAMETIQNKFNEYAQQHGVQIQQQQQQQQPQYAQDWPTAEKEINQVVKGNFNNWPAQVKQAGWPDDKIAAYRQLANNNARQQRQKKQQQAQQQPQQQQQAISEAIDRVVDKYLK